MANEILIEDIVNLSKIDSDFSKLEAYLNNTDKLITEINKKQITISNASSLSELKKVTQELVSITDNLGKVMNQAGGASKAAADASLKNAKAKTEEAKQTTEASKQKVNDIKATQEQEKADQQALKTAKLRRQEEQAAIKAQEDAAKKAAQQAAQEQKLVDELTNEYKQLNKALIDAETRYKNLYLIKGKDAQETQEALQTALGYRKILETIDNSLGNYQRNIGNYSSATKELRYQFGLLLRESPNLANGLNTVLLAVSNNLPFFFDAVKKVKEENQELAASGEKPVSLFTQLGAALVDPINLLTVGVALLTVFGGKLIDWVASLLKGKDAIDNVNERLYDFKKAADDAAKAVEELRQQLDFLNKSYDLQLDISVINRPDSKGLEKDLLNLQGHYVELREKTLPGLKKQWEDTFSAAEDAQDKLSRSVGRLPIELQNAFDEVLHSTNDVGKAIARMQDIVDSGIDLSGSDSDAKEEFEKVKRIAQEYLDLKQKAKDVNQEELKADQDRILLELQIEQQKVLIAKRQADLNRELLLTTLNAEQDIIKTHAQDVLNEERSSFSQRLGATDNFYKAQRQIIINNRSKFDEKSKLFDPTTEPQERKAAFEKANSELIALQIEQNRKEFEIYRERIIRLAEADTQIFETRKSALTREEEFEKDIYTRQSQYAADKYKELAKVVEFSLRDRLQLEQNYADVQEAIADKAYQFQAERVEKQKEIISKQFELEKTKDAFKFLTPEEKQQKELEYFSKLRALNLEAFTAQADHESQLVRIAEDSQKRITDNLKLEISKRQNLLLQDVEQIKRLFVDQNLHHTADYSEEIIALNEALKKGEITREEYNKRRVVAERKNSTAVIQIHINEIETILSHYDGAEGRLEAGEIKLQGLREKLNKVNTESEGQLAELQQRKLKAKTEGEKAAIDASIELLKKKTQAEKEELLKQIDLAIKELEVEKINNDAKKKMLEELLKLKKELSDQDKKGDDDDLKKLGDAIGEWITRVQALNDAVTGIRDAQFQRTLDRISAEKDAVEDRYQTEVDLINQTVSSQEEKKRRLDEAEAKRRAQQRALDEQERQEKVKQAKFDKQQAIFNIILNTARSISAVLDNPAKVITASVVGAAQLAIAMAQPIPRYYRGKNAQDHYEGYAIVDDGKDGRGKAELIIREDGSMEIGENKPRVTYLNRNDIVIPEGEKAKQSLLKAMNTRSEQVFHSSISRDTLVQRSMLNSREALQDFRLIVVPDTGQVRAIQHLATVWKRENSYLRQDIRSLNRGRKMNWRDFWAAQDNFNKLKG
jgi:hypothetical protein